MNFLHLIKTGGFVMYPLLIFSVLIWAILFERIWFLHYFRQLIVKLNGQIKDLSTQSKKHEIAGLVKACDPNVAVCYTALIEQANEASIQRRLQEIFALLKKRLWILATIASAAPFIGLFGTVIGIIRSFEDIAQTGKGGFSIVAAGLSEALVATATGIIVAVTAVLIYNYLMNKINALNLEFRNNFLDLADEMKEQ
jgi:biopolymer transport protein ExbB/TolQ